MNVHPAKTEVRFRRAAAVADAVREAIRSALASGGYAPAVEDVAAATTSAGSVRDFMSEFAEPSVSAGGADGQSDPVAANVSPSRERTMIDSHSTQPKMDWATMPIQDEDSVMEDSGPASPAKGNTGRDLDAILRRMHASRSSTFTGTAGVPPSGASHSSSPRHSGNTRKEVFSAEVGPIAPSCCRRSTPRRNRSRSCG